MGFRARAAESRSNAEEMDAYFAKSTRWQCETAALRAILLDAGLEEAIKWGKACYSADGHNIVIIQKMKNFLALMFFRGVLLDDPKGLLKEQGANTHSARRMTFTSKAEVLAQAKALRVFLAQAMEVARDERPLPPKPAMVLVDEIKARLATDAKLKAAFSALTPGRQRAYNLFVSSAKQTTTRARRFEGYIPKILAGKGPQDR